MKWLEESIMMKRGVGADREPVEHHLTEELQKTFHYTIGPYSEPVLHVKPGDRVVVDTRDAFEGKIKNETDKPSEVLKVPFLNPQNGPIMIEGAEKGDVVAVYIEKMTPRGD
ncbi:MAG: acetamidase/formamidase family protein, partial [Paraburkholderia hospita]